jgi:NAD(P) transhydrogenase
MVDEHFDVVVIGCGPAGQHAASRCARAGQSVALVDERLVVGGQCLHVGTIPSKTLRAAILHASGYYERAIFGDDHRGHGATHAALMARLRSVVGREVEVIHGQLERSGVRVIHGRGRLMSARRVEVRRGDGGFRFLVAKHIVLAVGTTSVALEKIPFDGYHVLNTDQILKLPFLPRSLTVVGGGVVGLEYACMFSLLDIEVHLVTRYADLLPFVDRDVVSALLAHMERNGVVRHHERTVTGTVVERGKQVTTTLSDGTVLQTQMLFYAGQRYGATVGLGLECAGIQPNERGQIPVDERYRTSAPGIYAVGDVIGFPSLAATAIDQGRKAANHLVGLDDVPIHPLFPFGLYTVPDISMVGPTEAQLQRDGVEYAVGVGHYRDSAKGQILGDASGLVKLIFEPHSRKLLAVHIFGVDATELIHLGQAVMTQGGDIDYFVDTVFNYPTLAEVYKLAAIDGLHRMGAMEPGMPHKGLSPT